MGFAEIVNLKSAIKYKTKSPRHDGSQSSYCDYCSFQIINFSALVNLIFAARPTGRQALREMHLSAHVVELPNLKSTIVNPKIILSDQKKALAHAIDQPHYFSFRHQQDAWMGQS